MKRLASILAIFAGVLLWGCAESPAPIQKTSASTPPTTTSPVTRPAPNIAGNWQFTATSSTGANPFSIAGGISQADTTAGGALHIDNSSCFDRLITRSLAGTVSPDTTASLTATGSDGQVVILTGNFKNPTYFYGTVVYATFAGTYTVDGGCAAGDHGTVEGSYVDNIGRQSDPTQLSGTFTNGSAQQIFHATGNIVQNGSVSGAGSFEFTGNATLDTPCLGAGTITAGTYPSGSFILGTAVRLEFDTANGTLTFLGTLNPDRNNITGNYTVSGGTCNESGTAVLSLSSAGLGYWDY
jgi:hypothetical protein